MDKNSAKRNVLFLTIGVVVLVLVINISLGFYLQSKSAHAPSPTPIPKHVVQKNIDTFSYKGEAGKDALTILKAKTSVKQNSSGLVVLMNGRKADDKKHEFWAFYVNGKMAEVGPADYKTKDGDVIEWKIETY